MSRAEVSYGCGATAIFEDAHSVPVQINVEHFHKAHESCRIAKRSEAVASNEAVEKRKG